MPKPEQPAKKNADQLADIGKRVQEYAACIEFAEWLAENSLLSEGAAKEAPEQLAYSFAIRFSNQRAALDAIIGKQEGS